jgi:PAS domain S-box-containing protein
VITRDTNIHAPRERVRRALAEAVHGSLRPVLLAAAALYVGFAASHWLTLPRPEGAIVAAIEAASVVVALLLWRLVGSIARPSPCTYPIGVAINVLLLGNICARVVLLRDPHQGLTVLPLFVGVGFFFLSLPWMVSVLAGAVVIWAASTAAIGAAEELPQQWFAALASVAIAAAVHVVRVRALTRVENLRYADELRAAQLQVALTVSDELREQAERTGADLQQSLSDLAQTEARYRDIFDNAHDLIAAFQPTGQFVYANDAWTGTLGYDAEELASLGIYDIVSPESVAPVLSRLDGLVDEATGARIECDVVAKDGRIVRLEGRLGASVERGRLTTVRAIFRDVTERREAERLKEEFIATVSHELRTPLTSIQGALELVTAGAAGTVPDTVASLLTIAYENGHRLVKLVDDILDMSKIEAGEMAFHMELVDVMSVARMSVDVNAPFAAQCNSVIRLDEPAGEVPHGPVYVTADAGRLGQVLTNLLSNAAKFSRQDTEITVTVTVLPSRVRISVRDVGEGIPEAARERVFDKFMQLDGSSTRAHGGAGLGLAISKAIVQRLGGTIAFESEVGEGTTFHVELPLADAGGVTRDTV